jgi:FtsZ-binding cell division protein ZapB
MDQELVTQTDETNEQDGFDADEVATKPLPTERPEEQAAEVAAEAVVEQAIEYAQLTKAEYEELKALKQAQERSFGTAFGKIGGIERTLQQLQAGAKVDISQEDIDSLKDDFPPIAAALEKIRGMRALPAGVADPAQIEQIVQQRIAPALTAVEHKFELRMLAKEHPDYKNVDADPAFAKWVSTQPQPWREELVTASENYDSEVVGAAMHKFKLFKKQTRQTPAVTPPRNSRQIAAVTPRGSGLVRAPVGNDEASGFDAA